jgi:hypothetical protein
MGTNTTDVATQPPTGGSLERSERAAAVTLRPAVDVHLRWRVVARAGCVSVTGSSRFSRQRPNGSDFRCYLTIGEG